MDDTLANTLVLLIIVGLFLGGIALYYAGLYIRATSGQKSWVDKTFAIIVIGLSGFVQGWGLVTLVLFIVSLFTNEPLWFSS